MNAKVRIAVLGVSLVVVLYVGLGAVLGRTVNEGAYQQLAVLSEVLTRIQNDYVEDPNMTRVTAGGLHGLAEALDPFSSYLSPREYTEYQKKKAKNHVGEVGLVLSKRYGLVNIVSVLPESPASRAELSTGDIVESIEGFSTREMSVDQAYLLLTGEPGTSVKLSVVRAARAEPQPLELVRAKLKPTAVVSGPLEDGIGYMKIAAFSPGKSEEVAGVLRGFKAKGTEKLVVDLRDCASGQMDEAVAVARALLDNGVITYYEGQQVPRKQFKADAQTNIWTGPLTVLIDAGTAGPAEVVASAVLANKRGDVVGQRSYGVGVVQRLIPLDDGSALILSVAKYYTPDGQAIQDHAVTPSVEVPLTEAPTPSAHALPPPGDPVLQKAVELLRAASVTTQAHKAA